LENAIGQAYDLIDKGFKEIVLTGVNIGEYEASSGVALAELVKKILEIPGLERFRLSSVEPNTMTDELIEVLKNSPKVMDHFHIPLQSGSDKILTSMRRKYRVGDYKKILQKLKKAFPHCGIGADIILGHPGESSGQFDETYELLKELPVTHFHAFPYSKRQGTTASKLQDHIPTSIKKERVSIINQLGERKLAALSQTMVGKVNNVLFEKRNRDGFFEGYTTNFIRIAVDSTEDLSNLVKKVYIAGWDDGLLRGEVVDNLL
jgi:threonylcarbamoyladenosine tRNA methylthiotransferase MtaB